MQHADIRPSRRSALLGGIASAAGLVLVKAAGQAFAQSGGSSSGASLPVDMIQSVFGASGTLEEGGVLHLDFPRTDIQSKTTPSIFNIVVDPGWGFDTEITFQPVGNGTAIVKWEFALLEPEINPVLDALFAAQLQPATTNLNAIHNHFIEEVPRIKFVHGTAVGDPVQIAQALRSALRQSAQPFMSSSERTPSALEDQIAGIIGGQGTASGATFSVTVPRNDQFSELGITLASASQIQSMLVFQQLGNQSVVDTEIPVLPKEADAVARSLRHSNFTLMALHNHELFIDPTLYYLHALSLGDPIAQAQAIRQALELTDSQFTS